MVSRSSAETELCALAQGICEGLWLKRIMEELRMNIQLPVEIYCDNISAISMAENPTQHDKSKHVEINRHFIQENIENKIIHLKHIPSNQQAADIFTKPISIQTFVSLVNKLGCTNIYTKLEEECRNP